MHTRLACGQVYAIDLLGFGRSDKPLLSYSIELWTEQLLDFLSEFVDQPSILVGNSIGSLISLMVKAPCSSQCRCAVAPIKKGAGFSRAVSAPAACAEHGDVQGLLSVGRAKPGSQ